MLFAFLESGGHHHEPDPVKEVQDTNQWPFFEFLFKDTYGPVVVDMPLLIDWNFLGINHKTYFTKYMALELIAALLIIAIYVPLARRIRSGGLPTGKFWNLFEVFLIFVRDQIARPNLDRPKHEHGHGHGDHALAHGATMDSHGQITPAIPHGHGPAESAAPPQNEPILGDVHEGDAYVPFLWTVFLFILFCNLLGMLPFMGSPTASIWVTGAMALISFVMMHVCVVARHGFGAYLKSLWPAVDMPPGIAFTIMGFFITALLAVIELMGGIIKGGVLAVRLFANMFAGHLVLANILLFIYAVGKVFGPGAMWGGVTVASVLGVVALSLLELFVAFLQAYIFTFLTALFMGMAMSHAEHH